jgi:hypothetical protein
MEEIKDIKEYRGFKQALDMEFMKAAEGFVKIGYLLKVARDTDILEKSGYKNVSDFAQKEYGLTKDIVSRYIAINDRYSEGGYSEKLKTKFQGYGYSKLAEMLTLSDVVIDSIPIEATRAAIQDIKREIKEEERITDLEVLMEGENEGQKILENNLQKFLHQFGYENRQTYIRLWEVVKNKDFAYSAVENILDILAPTGFAMITERIQGIGKMMLSIRGKDNVIELINTRSNEKETYTWLLFVKTIEILCSYEESASISWESLYNEPFQEAGVEEKQEVAPVQPENSPKAPDKLQEDPGQEADGSLEIGSEENTSTEIQQEEAAGQQENEEVQDIVDSSDLKEDIQMDIENYPEYLPEGYIKCEDGIEVHETATYQKWKDVQSFIKDLHSQIVDRLEPDIETSRKLRSGVSYLKSIMDDFVETKEKEDE